MKIAQNDSFLKEDVYGTLVSFYTDPNFADGIAIFPEKQKEFYLKLIELRVSDILREVSKI
ncbi:hypothetical protein Hs30E_10390 [Lactococcus hodotermopsidis]|uniref:Transcriptional regulator n=1 Tax=Pseudolactococcus hodotermopsidis TaxID=2709157 RepID=A0A6A0BDR9_9LACT|nr:hypothetical protein [Lactococcus hodotermopsidis]GFH42488.1 hypothetical protein Hs30E_10390 [Lactococcus hodotermopsidis]